MRRVSPFQADDQAAPAEAAPAGNTPKFGQPLKAIVSAITDPLFAMDPSWCLTYVNRGAEQHLGRPSKALLGKNFWDTFPDSIHTKYYHEYHKAVTNQEPREFEFYHEIQGRWFEASVYPFAEGLLVFLRDVTQRHQAQEKARKLEKLEGLGLLARGFAHDFNNLLTILLGNVSLARYAQPGETDYQQSLDAAKLATNQAQSLVQQLLTFAKGGAPITETVDLNKDVIKELLNRRRRQPHLQYVFNLTEESVLVEADPGQLQRVVGNLIENAEEAMLSGGTLTLTTSIVHANARNRQELSDKLDPHTDYTILEVHDTGEGIPDVHLDKVLEPYFSTRSDANATGLGLTVCDSIARSHGGFLAIDSKLGSHTAVRLFLPTQRQRWQSKEPSTGAPKRQLNQPPRILILEDERPIRLLISLSLKKDGYHVVETEEGSQTVETYRAAMAEGKHFDLVIMDLSIPNGMGGAEAIQQIRYADPDVVAVVSSGYSDDPVMANYTEYGFAAVLPKPYEPAALRELASSLLSQSSKNS